MVQDLYSIMNTLQDLERTFELGYGHKYGMKIEKFSQFDLQANTLSLASSFNNLNPFLDTPTELYLTSSDIADAGKKVTVLYISQDRSMQEVEYTLNGQTAVSIGIDKYCIWRMFNSNGSNYVGSIYAGSEAVPVGGIPSIANTYCEIPITFGDITPVNQSLTGIFSVPAGYTGILTLGHIGASKGVDLRAAAFIRELGGVFRYSKTLAAFETVSTLPLFTRIPEKTDIKPVAFSQSGGVAHLDYNILLIKNEYIDRFN